MFLEIDDRLVDIPLKTHDLSYHNGRRDLTEDEADSSEDELQKRFDRMTFVVATRKLSQLPQWVKVTEVFKSDSDAPFLKRAGVGGFDDPNFEGGGAQELIDRLRQQVGRLDIAPEELEGRNQRSALFKTMYLAFRAAGAKDWRSQVTIALDHTGVQHRLQFHHIFPKAVLKSSYTGREADDIANLCFIAGKTNRQISGKPPSHYFPPMIEKSGLAAFEAQSIPTDTELLGVDGYKAFLQRRREAVARRLNEFLGV